MKKNRYLSIFAMQLHRLISNNKAKCDVWFYVAIFVVSMQYVMITFQNIRMTLIYYYLFTIFLVIDVISKSFFNIIFYRLVFNCSSIEIAIAFR